MPAKRALGQSGLSTMPLALGGNVFGWTADAAASHAVLDRFVDSGCSLIDTADVYSRWVPGHSGGESEVILGEWMASRKARDRVIVATKFGGEIEDGAKGLSAAHIRFAVEGSLKRLRTDYIDLYQAHYADPDVGYEETLEALGRLIEQGKVRAIGVSNHSRGQIEAALAASAAHGLPRYETIQPLYNLYDRAEFENEFADLCQKNQIGAICFKALANGFLAGKYRTPEDLQHSRRAKATGAYLNDRGLRILDALDSVADDLSTTPAQVALAWVMARPGVTAAIASATSPAQLDDQLAALHLTLSGDHLALLEQASTPESEGHQT